MTYYFDHKETPPAGPDDDGVLRRYTAGFCKGRLHVFATVY